MKEVKLFATSENHSLTNRVLTILSKKGMEVHQLHVPTFKSGEQCPEAKTSVDGIHCVLFWAPVDTPDIECMRLFLSLDALKRAGAEKITIFVPYYFYARQDQTNNKRQAVSAAFIAEVCNMYEASVITVHIHNKAIQGYFKKRFHSIGTKKIFLKAAEKYFSHVWPVYDREKLTLVAVDNGASKELRSFAKEMNIPLIVGDKYRANANEVEEIIFSAPVYQDRFYLGIDDLTDTGGTLAKASEALVELGADANKIVMAVTSPVFSGDAHVVLQNAPCAKFLTTDTLNIPEGKKFEKLEIVSISKMISTIILKYLNGESIRDEDMKDGVVELVEEEVK